MIGLFQVIHQKRRCDQNKLTLTLSWMRLILLFIVLEWNIHTRGQKLNQDLVNACITILRLLKDIKVAMRSRACNFLLALLKMEEVDKGWISNKKWMVYIIKCFWKVTSESTKLISLASLNFSIINRRQCWALYPFWKRHWLENTILSKHS